VKGMDEKETNTQRDENDLKENNYTNVDEKDQISESKKNNKNVHKQGLGFDQYLSGSGIGFSTFLLLIVGIVWTLENIGITLTIPLKVFINVIPSIIGSALGSFLFIRLSKRDYYKDGLIIGFGGFIITFIYTFIMGENVGSAYVLFGFIFGGLLGGTIVKYKYE
jgi:hypothetical protein